MFKYFASLVRGKLSESDPSKLQTRFSLRLNKRVRQVTVAGSFNHWSPFHHALRLSSSGTWEIVIPLVPGTYQYRFLVDNTEWVLDPFTRSIFNEHGGRDSIVCIERREKEMASVRKDAILVQTA